ncbi:hypothetical protein COO04_10040 [Bacillus toyonensis]|nr:hypothetical protein COO04_10040 [Bacillus toyonensis]
MEEMFVSLFIQANSNNIEKMNTYKEKNNESIRDLTISMNLLFSACYAKSGSQDWTVTWGLCR